MPDLEIRRSLVFVDHRPGPAGEPPLRKVAAVLVVKNPCAGRHEEDLSAIIAASASAGETIARLAVDAMGEFPAQSYGKAGIVGMAGEQEHANAMLTTTFAEPLRQALGGALAWIPSFTKVAAPGASIDVPLAHKDALYVRSHYDGMTVALPPETPMPDEVALIVCLANRGRIGARVGGLKPSEIAARDGLR